MIQTHLYAKNTVTPVYCSPSEDGHPGFVLHQGNWMGVLEEQGKWLHVIAVGGEGWVQREFAEVRAHGDLHILLMEDRKVEYVNSSPGI